MRYLEPNPNTFKTFRPLVRKVEIKTDKLGLPIETSLFLEKVIEDIDWVNGNGDVTWYMNTWVNPKVGACTVCLAGAIYIHKFGIPNEKLEIQDVPQRIKAVDLLREGNISAFLSQEPAFKEERGYDERQEIQREIHKRTGYWDNHNIYALRKQLEVCIEVLREREY